MAQLLRASERHEEKWRNGGGSTSCIAIAPEGARLDHFAWRISMARIDRSGPFSSFPGIDRTLIPVEGTGLTLFANGRRIDADHHGHLRFAGEEAVEATIADLPVRDINVMTERSRARHSVARMTGADVYEIPCLSDQLCIIALTPGHERTLGRFDVYDCIVLQQGEQALIRKDAAPLELLAISLWTL